MTAEALAAFQQVSESVLVLFFKLCNKAAIHAKRMTVMPLDATFVKEFINIVDPTNPIGYAVKVLTPQKEVQEQNPPPNAPSSAQTKRPAGTKKGIAVTKTKGKTGQKK